MKQQASIQKRKRQTKPSWALTPDIIQKVAIREAERWGWYGGAGIIRVAWPKLPKYAIDVILEKRIILTKDNKVIQAKKPAKKRRLDAA